MAISGHGGMGFHLTPFTELLPQHATSFEPSLLADLAKLMRVLPEDAKDGPNLEENLWVPTGYTFLGQFVDHGSVFGIGLTLGRPDLEVHRSQLRRAPPSHQHNNRWRASCGL